MPSQRGIKPSYEQKSFGPEQRSGQLRLVASPDARDGSTLVHADASLYAGTFDAEQSAELALAPNRHAWVQVARGRVTVNGHQLEAGDGAALSSEPAVRIEKGEAAEVLVFELG
ncbi:MAG: hypothetical protein QM756_44370 [Polyangiaceae bacterium]